MWRRPICRRATIPAVSPQRPGGGRRRFARGAASTTAWDARCRTPATAGIVALVVASRRVPATVSWRRRGLGPAPRRCGGARSGTAKGEARSQRTLLNANARAVRQPWRARDDLRRPQSDGDAGRLLWHDGAWREATSTGELPLLPGGTAPSHPSNCVTWRRNERRDGDGGGSQRGKGEGEGFPLHESEGEAHPRCDGDRAGGGVDDNGAETGGHRPILLLRTEASATN